MGMYDSINIWMRCPYCDKFQTFDAQTKDMDCQMWRFDALPTNWFDKNKKVFDKILDRNKLPVFKKTPYDKSANVWKSQGEKMESMSRVPDEFKDLKFVNVIADCHSAECQTFADKKTGYKSGFGRMFEGKVKIKNGYLIGEIYDIVKTNR